MAKYKKEDVVACNSGFSFDPIVGVIKRVVSPRNPNPLYRVRVYGWEDSDAHDGTWNYFEKELTLLEEIEKKR